MGGAYLAKGNSWIPAVEFNFYVDPEAAYVVLEAWDEVTIVPWETSIAHTLTADQVQRLGSFPSRRAEFYRQTTANRFVPQISGPPALHESDGLAMLVATEPDAVAGEEYRYACIELGGATTRGQLIVDWYQLCQKPHNVRIVTAVDHARFLSSLERACGRSLAPTNWHSPTSKENMR
jgi:purine nucleosidase